MDKLMYKKDFDFVITDWDFYRDVLRFRPKTTHVHSFNDKPPKTWGEVYKVYYSYTVLRQYKDDSGNIVPESSEYLYDIYCDECSEFPNLSGIIKHVMETGETWDNPTFGQPATDWEISQHKGTDWDNKPYERYKFVMFDNWQHTGYKFWLDKEQTLRFCDWLDMVNQYALEHGEEI